MTLDVSQLADVGLALPSEILVPHPQAVAGYLLAHPGLVEVVSGMAAALVDEFRGERSAVELLVDEDDYVDERSLVFNVRAATYDERFVDRLNGVAAQFDHALTGDDGWVQPMSDLRPVE